MPEGDIEKPVSKEALYASRKHMVGADLVVIGTLINTIRKNSVKSTASIALWLCNLDSLSPNKFFKGFGNTGKIV